jgi:uncharacterized membrane protein
LRRVLSDFHYPRVDIRLILAMLVGMVAFFFLPLTMPGVMRAAIAWDGGAFFFLSVTFLAVGNADFDALKKHAGQQDAKLWIILAIVVVAAVASLASLAIVMQKEPGPNAPSLHARIAVSVATILISWVFVHMTFAIRYAHYFCSNPAVKGKHRGGLAFPGTERPDFWDFAYYSFVVGMTCQVSDVQVTSGAMRRLTLFHGILTFFFNAGVLALAVNILGTAL